MKIKSITIKCDALLLKQRKIGISDRRYPVIMGVPVATHYQLNERRYRANPLNPLAIRI